MDNRAVTTYNIDDMYLTEEGKEDERDAEEGMARGSTTLGRPIIVGVDRKTGGVTRAPSEMRRQWRPLDCDKNCNGEKRIKCSTKRGPSKLIK